MAENDQRGQSDPGLFETKILLTHLSPGIRHEPWKHPIPRDIEIVNVTFTEYYELDRGRLEPTGRSWERQIDVDLFRRLTVGGGDMWLKT